MSTPASAMKPPAKKPGPIATLKKWRRKPAVVTLLWLFAIDGTLTTFSALADGNRPPIVNRLVGWADWTADKTEDPPSLDLPSISVGS